MLRRFFLGLAVSYPDGTCEGHRFQAWLEALSSTVLPQDPDLYGEFTTLTDLVRENLRTNPFPTSTCPACTAIVQSGGTP